MCSAKNGGVMDNFYNVIIFVILFYTFLMHMKPRGKFKKKKKKF